MCQSPGFPWRVVSLCLWGCVMGFSVGDRVRVKHTGLESYGWAVGLRTPVTFLWDPKADES